MIRKKKGVTVEASITKIDDARRMILASGSLPTDGLPIHEMQDFGLSGWGGASGVVN